MDIKDRLKAAMSERGLTASELATKSGINKGLISKYLHGRVIPKQSAIGELSRALDVSPAWLLGYDVNQKGELLQPQIQMYKLTTDNQTRLLAYYQALIDSQEGNNERTDSTLGR